MAVANEIILYQPDETLKLDEKVGFFVRSTVPSKEGGFSDGQISDF